MGSEQTLRVPGLGSDTERVVIWLGDDKFYVTGNTVPSNGADGYAPGCTFMKADGGAATTLYVNEGTLASADFNVR